MSDQLTSSEQSISTQLEDLSIGEEHPCIHDLPDGAPEEGPDSQDETENERLERMQQQLAIRKALDQQTQLLYEQYAQEQHPKEVEKQRDLVLEMQEQNFLRYMSEVYQYQILHQQQQLDQLYALNSPSNASNENKAGVEDTEPKFVWPLIPAVLWTRKDLGEFKQEVMKTQRECCIKIGSLATATIRVPTHSEGSAIFWEFATDHYDLGFGVYFEWDIEPSSTISVTISESSDDEDEPDEEGGGNGAVEPQTNGDAASRERSHPLDDESGPDVERGGSHSGPRRPTDELIPIYRRDSHKEVYCGSHQYPGMGVYVFKFDNSFSLWRSKWLYYRIYYTH